MTLRRKIFSILWKLDSNSVGYHIFCANGRVSKKRSTVSCSEQNNCRPLISGYMLQASHLKILRLVERTWSKYTNNEANKISSSKKYQTIYYNGSYIRLFGKK